MYFLSIIFSTVKRQFLIECLTAVFSKLQVNPIQPLVVPQAAFLLALTLIKVLLSTSMTKFII